MQITLALQYVLLGTLLLAVHGCGSSIPETAAIGATSSMVNAHADSSLVIAATATAVVASTFASTAYPAAHVTPIREGPAYLSAPALPTIAAPATFAASKPASFFQALAASVLPATRGWPSITLPAFPIFSGPSNMPSSPFNITLPDLPTVLSNQTLLDLLAPPSNMTLAKIAGILGNYTFADLLPLLANATFPNLLPLPVNITMADLPAVLEKIPMLNPAAPTASAATAVPTYPATEGNLNVSDANVTTAIPDSGLFGNFFCFTPQNTVMSGLGCW